MHAPEAGEPRHERAGLGLVHKKKKERKRLAAHELPNGSILYGRGHQGLLKIVELDPRGKAITTDDNLP